jgi:hypothetical protein
MERGARAGGTLAEPLEGEDGKGSIQCAARAMLAFREEYDLSGKALTI